MFEELEEVLNRFWCFVVHKILFHTQSSFQNSFQEACISFSNKQNVAEAVLYQDVSQTDEIEGQRGSIENTWHYQTSCNCAKEHTVLVHTVIICTINIQSFILEVFA